MVKHPHEQATSRVVRQLPPAMDGTTSKDGVLGSFFSIQWPFHSRPKFQGISPQNMANNMVLTYFHLLDPGIPIDFAGVVDDVYSTPLNPWYIQ